MIINDKTRTLPYPQVIDDEVFLLLSFLLSCSSCPSAAAAAAGSSKEGNMTHSALDLGLSAVTSWQPALVRWNTAKLFRNDVAPSLFYAPRHLVPACWRSRVILGQTPAASLSSPEAFYIIIILI
jgi:hypothetical protein